jgi:hypothetical protein
MWMDKSNIFVCVMKQFKILNFEFNKINYEVTHIFDKVEVKEENK